MRPSIKDHPRSRGVYPWVAPNSPSSPGSSPLARGLPIVGWIGAVSGRIIPARAEFTPHQGRESADNWDHPRSRGVYGALHRAGHHRFGSSPLARGLLPRPLTAIRTPGIIPARAGFTGRRRPQAGSERDHPRSRGVYPKNASIGLVMAGSSPLARGLRAG